MIIVIISTAADSCCSIDSVSHAMKNTVDIVRAIEARRQREEAAAIVAALDEAKERQEPITGQLWVAPSDHTWTSRCDDRPPLKVSGYG